MSGNITYLSFYFGSNTIHVFQSAVKSIGNPDFIRFRISGDKRQMVMEPYDKKELTSFRVPKKKELNKMQVRGKRFCAMVIAEMGWDASVSYRIPGKVYEQQSIVLFDLENAVMIPPRG